MFAQTIGSALESFSFVGIRFSSAFSYFFVSLLSIRVLINKKSLIYYIIYYGVIRDQG